MKSIDVHNHLYPKEWMEYLDGRAGSPTMTRTGPTSMVFYSDGMRLATVSRPAIMTRSPVSRISTDMAIDIQVVSLTCPSVELIPAKEGVVWARKSTITWPTCAPNTRAGSTHTPHCRTRMSKNL